MHYLSAHITLAHRWVFTAIHDIRIEDTMDELTDTATLSLPRKIQWRHKNVIVDKPLKRGDSVGIQLGYDGQLTEVFAGYIRSIAYEDTVQLTCENAMFALKSAPVVGRVITGNLGTLLQALIPATIPLYPTADHHSYIGSYRLGASCVAAELAALKTTFGLHVFFIGNELFVGWLRPHRQHIRAHFRWGHHIIDSDLTYQSAEDVPIQIHATAFNEKGKRIHLVYGDKGGEERSFFVQHATKEALQEKAKQFYLRLKKPKYQGSFTTFGVPVIHKGDPIRLSGRDGHTGTYLVKAVHRQFGKDGYRQSITLDYQIH